MIKCSVVTIKDKTAQIGPVTRTAIQKGLRKATFDTMSQAIDVVPVDTGNLKGSIRDDLTNLDNLEASVSAGAEYAIYVEMGTHKMPARPFLIPAGDHAAKGFEPYVKALIKAGLG